MTKHNAYFPNSVCAGTTPKMMGNANELQITTVVVKEHYNHSYCPCTCPAGWQKQLLLNKSTQVICQSQENNELG